MRSLAFVLCVVSVVTGCKRSKETTAGDSTVRGTVYSSTEAKVEAWFPEKPSEENQKNLKQIKLLVPEAKGVYTLSARQLDRKVDLANKTSIELFMAGARIGLLSGPNKGGRIISDEKYQHDGKFPAARIDVESPKLGIYRIRLIQTTTHFYQVIVAGPKEFVDSADATKFLDSVKITE